MASIHTPKKLKIIISPFSKHRHVFVECFAMSCKRKIQPQPIQEWTMNHKNTKEIKIDYLYLDNNSCNRCRSSEESLDEAASLIGPVLEAVGCRLSIQRHHINSLELAEAFMLESSPSIRINGREIQPKPIETHCTECSNLAGGRAVDCRIWDYRVTQSEKLPIGLLIEEILHTIFHNVRTQPHYTTTPVPSNIRRYFDVSASVECEKDNACSC
ncbi:DUF2703 domain-containing protein [Billgrantia azerbaijanica]|nr:DUF2703 domain-containing protein [Halomonas azerbaijanica]